MIEIASVLVVLAVLAFIAVPSYQDMIDKNRLRSAAEVVHATLQNAKSLTQQKKTAVYVSFAAGAAWCLGLTSSKPACACTQADPAQADFCEDGVSRAAEYRGTMITSANFGGTAATTFEPVRGTAVAGSVDVQSTRGKQARIGVSALGRVLTCSPAGAGSVDFFPPC